MGVLGLQAREGGKKTESRVLGGKKKSYSIVEDVNKRKVVVWDSSLVLFG